MLSAPEEPPLESSTRLKKFLTAHWRGVIVFLAPIVCCFPFLSYSPIQDSQWTSYCLLVVVVFWVSECIPLPVTALLPIIIFPLSRVMNTYEVCLTYMNDAILMFLGSLILAYSIEQSGLHNRIALGTVRLIGYSHMRLLLSVCLVTMFISMWITNTAATVMVVPILFALLKVFEDYKLLKIYDINEQGEKVASDITTCYFCSVTYSATIGGVGTLVGTATNLAFKGVYITAFPEAPESLSFLKFSAFSIPYMLLMEAWLYFNMAVLYFGFLRKDSAAAKSTRLNKEALKAAEESVEKDWKKLGDITIWEILVLVLFSSAMILFFCRSPQVFTGWADIIIAYFGLGKGAIKDSAAAYCIGFLMLLVPHSLDIFKNFTADYMEDLPKKPVHGVLDWSVMNKMMAYSFSFLLGGGFALSTASKPEYSNLNAIIGSYLRELNTLPVAVVLLLLIVVTIGITNFASNVAVATVLAPIAMQMAVEMKVCPLWFNIAVGFSASYCFVLPVGTPGNLVVKSVASIPTAKMVKAGIGPTIVTILLTWAAVFLWAPVIWPELHEFPAWASGVP